MMIHQTLSRGGVLLSGLVLGATLAAQTTWIQHAPAQSPVARWDHGMADDALRGRVVLFGGHDSSSVFGDTWEWDGTNWSQLSPVASPPGRGLHAMAADLARARVVLFGGRTSSTPALSDTWEWGGSTWAPRSSTRSPPARFAHAMAYDAARRRVVLFGGLGPLNLFNDTWEWDGTNWTPRFPTTSPSPPWAFHAMAYDAVRGRTVLFGKTTASETWEWDGTNWLQRTPATTPPPRDSCSMAFDAARGRIVLFGGLGTGGVVLGDTWEWDGTTWSLRRAAISPGPRGGPVMAYQSARGRMVLFGGSANSTFLGDTWEYGPTFPASALPYGIGCSGSAGLPSHAALDLPWLGDSYRLATDHLPAPAAAFLFLGFSRTNWGAVPLPLDLTPIGMNGCALVTEIPLLFFASGPGGSATWTLPIPTGADLLGFGFFTQSLHLDATANPFGATLSNGVAGTIGGR